MFKTYFKLTFIVVAGIVLFASKSYANSNEDEQHILVSMRMIGHRILLNSGDSTSRVLPIEKEENRYKIQFESEFKLHPAVLVSTIDTVVQETEIATNYIVEVTHCETGQVVYSFEVTDSTTLDVIPCGTRFLPLDCYSIFFTISSTNDTAVANESYVAGKQSNYWMIIVLVVAVLLLAGLFFFKRKQKPKADIDSDLITIGKYHFDQKNMELSYENNRIELTSKEVDLLFILYTSANNTLKRDFILKKVWGDEGNYVGRTLDVFISKLRKKLEADSNVKIVNVRGIGYKLVVND